MAVATTRLTMNTREWAILGLLSVIWGGSFFFNGIAVKGLPPLVIVWLRVALAALALHLVLRALGQRLPRDRRIWGAFLVMGLFNNMVPFSLLVWGQTHIAGGLASILNATTPLFTVVVAHVWTSDDRMTGGRVAGILAGVAGVAAMIGPTALGGLGSDLLAELACLGAALSYGISGNFGRRFGRMGVSPLHTAAGQVTASATLLLPIVLLVDRPWALAMPGIGVWIAVAGLALLSTAFAYLLFFRLLATAGASNLSLVTFLVPVSAILLGTLFLGEHLEPRHFAGMALIGLAAIDGRPARALKNLFTARSG